MTPQRCECSSLPCICRPADWGYHHDTDDVVTPEVLDAASRACLRYGLQRVYTDPDGCDWVLLDARGFRSRASAQAYSDWFVRARQRAGLPVGGGTVALERNLPPQGTRPFGASKK